MGNHWVKAFAYTHADFFHNRHAHKVTESRDGGYRNSALDYKFRLTLHIDFKRLCACYAFIVPLPIGISKFAFTALIFECNVHAAIHFEFPCDQRAYLHCIGSKPRDTNQFYFRRLFVILLRIRCKVCLHIHACIKVEIFYFEWLITPDFKPIFIYRNVNCYVHFNSIIHKRTLDDQPACAITRHC